MFRLLLLCFLMVELAGAQAARPRARDLGINVGILATGAARTRLPMLREGVTGRPDHAGPRR